MYAYSLSWQLYGKIFGVKQWYKRCSCIPQTTSGWKIAVVVNIWNDNCVLPGIVASCPSEKEYWSLFKLALLITIYERVCWCFGTLVFLYLRFFGEFAQCVWLTRAEFCYWKRRKLIPRYFRGGGSSRTSRRSRISASSRTESISQRV